MKYLRHKTLWLALAIFALLAATVALFSYYSEPRYQGRPLSAWLQDYNRSMVQQAAAETAIRSIGSNACPILVKMLLPAERTFSISRLLKKTSIPVDLVEEESNHPTHLLAMSGFRILGPSASNAIPLLLPHLENKKTAYFVAEALETIGLPALASVQPLLNSTNSEIKKHSVHIILGITRRDPITVSNLLSYPDHIIRGETYLWLRSRDTSEYTFSALINGINDPHTYVAQRAVFGIRALELRDATNALPYLYKKQSPNDAQLAQEITSAIKNIEKRVRIENSDPNSPRR